MTTKSRLVILSADGTVQKSILETNDHIEAPNWSPDGKSLVFNKKDGLYKIAINGSIEKRIPIDNVQRMSNDHVISPDGERLFYSEKGIIYSVSIEGGQTTRLTSPDRTGLQKTCWLHGISPDGSTLVYCAIGADWKNGELWTIPSRGGQERRLYKVEGHNDGPDYSPDGQWIYFNSDLPGRAQIYRISTKDGVVERLTHDEKVNWFPHPSPDGKQVIYITYPEGTKKHPGDLNVLIMTMSPDGKNHHLLRKLFGGQGTINSPSWSPDSSFFAFVEYLPEN